MIKFLLVFLLICSPALAATLTDGADDIVEGTGFPTSWTDLSITFWYYCTRMESTDIAPIFHSSTTAAGWVVGKASGSDDFNISFRGVADNIFTNTEYQANKWIFIGITFNDSANEAKIYELDGTSWGTETISATGTISASNGTARIASFDLTNATNIYSFTGKISDVTVWSSVLTEDQIKTIGDSRVKGISLQISPSTLTAYWPLDDHPNGVLADGLVFRDRSGNGRNVTASDGVNNTGMNAAAEEVLSYPYEE